VQVKPLTQYGEACEQVPCDSAPLGHVAKPPPLTTLPCPQHRYWPDVDDDEQVYPVGQIPTVPAFGAHEGIPPFGPLQYHDYSCFCQKKTKYIIQYSTIQHGYKEFFNPFLYFLDMQMGRWVRCTGTGTDYSVKSSVPGPRPGPKLSVHRLTGPGPGPRPIKCKLVGPTPGSGPIPTWTDPSVL
jgi:hypothetical protein